MNWKKILIREWYLPQYNKARVNAEYHKKMEIMLSEDKKEKGLSRRHQQRLNHSFNATAYWEQKAERLLAKLEENERRWK